MSSTAKAHEPSMEEILASIRRIIADDEPAAGEKPAAPASAERSAPAPAPKPVAAPAPEPSGELGQDDIDAMLASFDAPALPEKEPPLASEAPRMDEDILELTKPVSKPAAEPPQDVQFRDPMASASAEPKDDLSAWGLADEEPPASGKLDEEPRPAVTPRMVEEALLAPEAGSAVASAFSSLAHTILGQNARTLDDLVQEMLRPMLKSWLDDNLPAVVERLVRAEIERVSRGPRR